MEKKTIGYARTAAAAQPIKAQIQTLTEAGCTEVFTDEGKTLAPAALPGFQRALAKIKSGDTLMVCRLDRISRDPNEMKAAVIDLTHRGIVIALPHEGPDQQLIQDVLADLWELEQDPSSTQH